MGFWATWSSRWYSCLCQGGWNKMMFPTQIFFWFCDWLGYLWLSEVVSRISVCCVFHSVVQQIYFLSVPLNQRSALGKNMTFKPTGSFDTEKFSAYWHTKSILLGSLCYPYLPNSWCACWLDLAEGHLLTEENVFMWLNGPVLCLMWLLNYSLSPLLLCPWILYWTWRNLISLLSKIYLAALLVCYIHSILLAKG